jgi:hypothetical protein
MKNKLIIIVLFSIIQIFSTRVVQKKSSDFVSSDGIVKHFQLAMPKCQISQTELRFCSRIKSSNACSGSY